MTFQNREDDVIQVRNKSGCFYIWIAVETAGEQEICSPCTKLAALFDRR
jgi:hypothetical protein